MSPRLPTPDGDAGRWGTVLNEFLEVEHNADGTLKAGGSLSLKADRAELDAKVPTFRTVNGKTLSDDIALDSSDIGLGNVANLAPADLPLSGATSDALNYIRTSRSRLLRFVALGDSITGSNHFNGYAGKLDMVAPGYFLFEEGVSASGVSGQYTSGMVARLQSDVISRSPDIALFCGGSNDAAGAASLAIYQANVTAIVDGITAAGIPLIVLSVPPRNAVTSTIVQYNTWLGNYCRQRGIAFIDLFRMFADPATGSWLPEWSDDGIHPTSAGSIAIVRRILQVLNLPLDGGAVPLLTSLNNQAGNLLQNALFQTDSNADGLADGWTLAGGGVATPSIMPSGDGDLGNWQRFDMTSGQRYLIRNVSLSGFASQGDTLFYGLRYRSGGQELTGKGTFVHFNVHGGSGHSGDVTHWSTAYDTDSAGLWMLGKRTLGSGATHASIDVTFNSADGGEWAAVAQPTILNLTALGLS